MHSPPRCLVAGSSNTALQVGRALGREGIEIHYLYRTGPDAYSKPQERSVGSVGHPQLPPSIQALSASRYCTAIHAFDSGKVGYAEAIGRISRQLDNPVILLTSDEFLMLHASAWEEISGLGIRVSLPSRETLIDVLDKARTFKTARRHNVGVPETLVLDGPPEASGGLEFPVIIKPRTSAGKFVKLGVKAFICRDEAELDQAGSKAFRGCTPA